MNPIARRYLLGIAAAAALTLAGCAGTATTATQPGGAGMMAAAGG